MRVLLVHNTYQQHRGEDVVFAVEAALLRQHQHLSRFVTEVLTQEENVKGLAHLNAAWVERAMTRTRHWQVILDMNSSENSGSKEELCSLGENCA